MLHTLKLCRHLYNRSLEERITTYRATGRGFLVIEYDIIGAFRKADCPICTVVADGADRYIRWFLIENYSQASTLLNLAEGGFCRDHAYQIAGLSSHQLSVTFSFITKDLARKIEKARDNPPDNISSRGKKEKHRFDALKRKKPCPVCDTIAFYEKYTGNVVIKLLSEEKNRELYRKSGGFLPGSPAAGFGIVHN